MSTVPSDGGDAARRGAGGATLAAGAVLIVAFAFALAWVYGPLEHYSPLVLLNLLLTYAAAALLGKAVTVVLKAGRSDGFGAAVFLALIGGLALVVFAWTTYLFAITGWNGEFLLELFRRPSFLLEYPPYLARNPLWSVDDVGRLPPAGYYLVWAAEAATLVLVPVAAARRFLRENSRCDSCGGWLRPTGDLAFFALPDGGKATLEAFRGGDLSRLPEAPRLPGPGEAPAWLEARGYACADCLHRDGFVGLSLVAFRGKKGEMVRREKKLVRFAPTDVAFEKRIFAPPSPPPPPPSSPVAEDETASEAE